MLSTMVTIRGHGSEGDEFRVLLCIRSGQYFGCARTLAGSRTWMPPDGPWCVYVYVCMCVYVYVHVRVYMYVCLCVLHASYFDSGTTQAAACSNAQQYMYAHTACLQVANHQPTPTAIKLHMHTHRCIHAYLIAIVKLQLQPKVVLIIHLFAVRKRQAHIHTHTDAYMHT